MRIVAAKVILTDGADKVVLRTDLPTARYPYLSGQPVEFHAARDYGESYVRMHLDIAPEVVNARTS